MRTISESLRLISLFLLLPLILLLIGPLLVLAVVRGHQSMGPIIWNTARYHPAGRLGILGLGLILWLLVWGGLVWLFLNTSFQPVLAQIVPPPPTPAEATEVELPATPTFTPAPTSTPGDPTSPAFIPTQDTATATLQDTATATLMATPTPTPETEPADDMPTPTPSPSATATALPPTVTATPTPAVTPTPGPTPTFGERQAAVETVKDANVLLRDAIGLANEENIGKLGVVWQGKALTVIENFAIDLYDRYTQPFTVEFEYLRLPATQVLTQTGQFVVTSQERWSYSGPTTTNREAFEFVYILEQINGRWAITGYTFRNLPHLASRETAAPTPTRRNSTGGTLTPTPTVRGNLPTGTPTPPPN